jgi:prevent-host-death family protein
MTNIDIHKAKTQLSKLIKYAQAGMEVRITEEGNPVAQVVAVGTSQSAPEKYGFLGWLEKNPLPAHAKRSGQEIDATVQESRSQWDKSDDGNCQRKVAS